MVINLKESYDFFGFLIDVIEEEVWKVYIKKVKECYLDKNFDDL